MGQSPSRRRRESEAPAEVSPSERPSSPMTGATPTTREIATQTKDPVSAPRPQTHKRSSTLRKSFLGLVNNRRPTDDSSNENTENNEPVDNASSGSSRMRRISHRLSRFLGPAVDQPDDIHEAELDAEADDDQEDDADQDQQPDQDGAHEPEIQRERPPTPMPLPITAPAPPTPPFAAPQTGATAGRPLPSAGPLVIVQGVVHTNDPTAPPPIPSSAPENPPPETGTTSAHSAPALPADTGISSSSMDVLGTLLTVAAQATAASLLTGSTEGLLGRPSSYPPTAFPSSSSSSASASNPSSPFVTTSSNTGGNPPTRRPPWTPFRDRFAAAPSTSSSLHPHPRLSPSSSPFAPSADPHTHPHTHPHPHPHQHAHGHGNFHEDRATMVADMARAFHLGLGMGLPGAGPAAPPRVPFDDSISDGGQNNNNEGREAPVPADGSFERFLFDLQTDLRIVLNGGTPPVRAGAGETLTRAGRPGPGAVASGDRVAAEEEEYDEDEGEDLEDEDDIEDEDEDSIGDDEDFDAAELQGGETTAATTPAMTPGELGGVPLAVAEEESPSSSLEPTIAPATDEPFPMPSVPEAAAASAAAGPPANGRPAVPPGTVNWWRLYRFPPIAASAAAPAAPAPAAASASTSGPSASDGGAAGAEAGDSAVHPTISTTTAAADLNSESDEASSSSSSGSSASTSATAGDGASTSTPPPTAAGAATPPQPQTVVPVIVIGLQSIRGPLGNLFAGAFAPPGAHAHAHPHQHVPIGTGAGRTPMRSGPSGPEYASPAPASTFAPISSDPTAVQERPDWEESASAEYLLEHQIDRMREREAARRREAEEREPLFGTGPGTSASGERERRRQSWWRLGRGRREPRSSATTSEAEAGHGGDAEDNTTAEEEVEEEEGQANSGVDADVAADSDDSPDPEIEAARAEARALALALAGALPGLSSAPAGDIPVPGQAQGESSEGVPPPHNANTAPTTEDSSRTFFIYVIGGYYPPDHGLVTGAGGIEALEALMDLDLLNYARPPRATKADIERSGLAIVRRDALPGKVMANCLEQCLICLDEYTETEDIRVLSCKHAFHQSCIDRWLEQGRNNCPACRTAGVPTEGRALPAM